MRANERTDERVAQYFSLYSWLLSTIVKREDSREIEYEEERIQTKNDQKWMKLRWRRKRMVTVIDDLTRTNIKNWWNHDRDKKMDGMAVARKKERSFFYGCMKNRLQKRKECEW